MIRRAEGTEVVPRIAAGLHLLLVDDEALAALAAGVEVAYDDPEGVPDEYAADGAELVEFFRGQP